MLLAGFEVPLPTGPSWPVYLHEKSAGSQPAFINIPTARPGGWLTPWERR